MKNRRGPATVTGRCSVAICHWGRHERPREGATWSPEARRPVSGQPIAPPTRATLEERGGSDAEPFYLAPAGRSPSPLSSRCPFPAPRRPPTTSSPSCGWRRRPGTLERATSTTNTEQIKTDPDALCFEDAEGGSGDRVRLAGPTALGLVETAGDATPAVNPLSVTDEFGFGLGLCGIGGFDRGLQSFWSLAVNHQALAGRRQPAGAERWRQHPLVSHRLPVFPPPRSCS